MLITVGLLAASLRAPGPLDADKTVILMPGSGFRGISARLAEEGVIRDPYSFRLLALLKGEAKKLKPGEYIFPARAPVGEILGQIVEGRTVIHRLTVPEGWRSKDIVDVIAAEPALTGELPANVQEGELLPETYYFSYGDTRAGLVERMREAMRAALESEWPKREEGLPLDTMQQALTLASIVEKETGLAAERPRVASVFINRLRKGMKLESDPTTQYAIERDRGPLGRSLTLHDLAYDSPYNTYVAPALPPGPIANPGRASIEAALHPLQTDELYFVADGKGGHNFGVSLQEHIKNVALWRAVRRTQKAESQKAGQPEP